jgi:hypothetical protein
MALSYKKIASQELTTTTASVVFTSIPQTYTDLMVRFTARANTADTNVNVYLRFNGDNAGVYSSRQMSWYSTATNYNQSVSGRTQIDNGPWATGANITSNVFASNTVYVPRYTQVIPHQVSILGGINNGATNSWAIDTAGLYSVSDAIVTVALFPYSGSFVAGSNFYLYGIA